MADHIQYSRLVDRELGIVAALGVTEMIGGGGRHRRTRAFHTDDAAVRFTGCDDGAGVSHAPEQDTLNEAMRSGSVASEPALGELRGDA